MEVQKIYVAGKNEAVIRCPHCGRYKTVDISKMRHLQKPIRVKCSCTQVMKLLLDERRHYRKPTNLTGYFSKVGSDEMVDSMMVENLSRSGLGFVVAEKTAKKVEVAVNDRINVRFRLDNPKGTVVKIGAVVRFVRDNYIGAEFVDLDEHNLKELGFYLMP